MDHEVTLQSTNNDPIEVTLESIDNYPIEVTLESINNYPIEVTLESINNDQIKVILESINNYPIEVTLKSINNYPIKVTLESINNYPMAENEELMEGLQASSETTNILDLPEEILLKIFGYVMEYEEEMEYREWGELGSFRLACHKFHRLAHDRKFVSRMRVHLTPKTTQNQVNLIKETIDIRREKLRSFLLNTFHLSDHNSQHLFLCKQLFITLENRLGHLEDVTIGKSTLHKEEFETLSRMKSLKKLSLHFHWTSQDLPLPTTVKFSPTLTHLTVESHSRFFPVEAFDECNNFQQLILSWYGMGHSCPSPVAPLILNSRENLKVVEISECDDYTRCKFDDSDFGAIWNCHNLEKLHLCVRSNIKSYKPIANLAKLRSLILWGVLDDCFTGGHLNNLTELKLSCYKMTSSGFQSIARSCSHLEIISLDGAKNMSDGDIIEFGQCRKLMQIEFFHMKNVTGKSIESLIKQLKHLRKSMFQPLLKPR